MTFIAITLLLFTRAFDPDVVRLMLRAYEVLEDAGASLIELALPMYGTLKAATVMGFCAEAFNYHRPRLRDSWLDYGLPARLAIAAGAFVTASEYIQIQRIRRVGTAEVNRLFAQVDIVATPTCLAPAPRVDELDFDNIVEVITTQYWSAVGYPAISVPMGRTGSGLPLGLQLAARPWDEAGLLNAAVAFQDRSAHHRERPVLSGGRG